MNRKIFYTKPSITELEIQYVTDAAANGWGENCYDYIIRFQNAFKEHLNVEYAIATSSCTGALHMGLAALGIGPEDEVILADTNWVATVAPIVYLGAKPIFVDISADSWCIDPDKAEEAITSKTKAIIVTHLYGNLCDMTKFLQIGEKYNVFIIEDAAEAIGSMYKEKRAGSMGNFGVFSFHGSKTLSTGEGGMLVTNDTNLHEKVLTLSNHGRHKNQKKQFWPDVLGFKYKISNVQAALGCAQLERIEELVARKRDILSFYRNSLRDIKNAKMNPEQPGTVNGAWMPTLVFDEQCVMSVDYLRDCLKKQDIDARVFFSPLSSLPMFSPVRSNVNAYSIPERALNLPSFHDISYEQLSRVADIILSEVEKYSG